MNKSDLLNKIKSLLNRMRDHETPQEVTSREELGPLLKDAEELLETVSVLKYLIEEENEQSEALKAVVEPVEEIEEKQVVEEKTEPITVAHDREPDEQLTAKEPAKEAYNNDTQTTINEVIAPGQESTKVGDKLVMEAVDDLNTAIGLNERFLFIKELFDGDAEAYQIAIEQLNGLSHLQDAMKFVRAELSEKYIWDQEEESTISFYTLIEKRYAE
ncbi:MAG: hypothetical protein JKY18_01400 [Flavobacteriales bacterium]|nr:hypothetical protein [Flavobacteriales bacterium]MBL4733994.1 hypothetical protein [Flavobacteriales bacterium]PCH86901.1 MAG: hypothetical protein COB88_06690 [Flavobacteriales bacterium]